VSPPAVLDAGLREALVAVVGHAHVLTDAAVTAGYATDWTRRFTGTTPAVVRPADTAQVAAVLAACHAAGQTVQVQGGNTGLVGGGVPAAGELVLSTTRLTALGAVDTLASQVSAGAGVTLAAAQAHARAAGLDVAVDLAARDSATLGGLVATNAGGERVLRHGMARAQVAGLTAVLADGAVLDHMAGLPKDNTGYDLAGLLAGSEGTLAVLTAVRLRLVAHLTARAVALVGLRDVADATALVAALRARLDGLDAAELLLADGLALVRAHTGAPAPLGATYPVLLLVEVAGRADPTDDLLAALGDADTVLDAAVASDARGRAGLWHYREAHTEAVNAAGVPVKLDVAVPVPVLPALVAALPGVVAAAAPGARLVVFGHVAEGNLHVNVLGAGERDEAVTAAVLGAVAGLGGSISAEHGIGRAKTGYLHLSRSPAEVAAMRAVKRALDPTGLLNPGVLLAE